MIEKINNEGEGEANFNKKQFWSYQRLYEKSHGGSKKNKNINNSNSHSNSPLKSKNNNTNILIILILKNVFILLIIKLLQIKN